jgi:WD40 repeat protein
VSGSNDNTLKLWDVKSFKEVKTLEGHISCVSSVVFSANGKYFASGSFDKTIKLWDVRS